jgi:hypothetical protein
MSDKQEVAVVETTEQKVVLFMNDELLAVRATDGEVYVSISHLSDALSLDRQGQTQRIGRSSVLLSGYRQGEITTPGGPQKAYLLRVDLVPFWLAGVSTSRVKDEDRRNKVEQYQQNVAKVLWEAFQEGRLTADSAFDDLLQTDTDAVQAYKMAAAIMRLARTQIMIEARLDSNEERLVEYEQRLEQIETQIGSGSTITTDQATAISQAVKTVARALGQQTGRNEYGGVYGELYRRYRIPTYRELPVSQYDDAIKWLGDWLESLTGDNPF